MPSTRFHVVRRLAVAAALLCCLGAGHRQAFLPTVPCVDLARFAGRWHEIARLPNAFQRGCVGAQACYTPRRDGTLGVVNTCTTARGR